MSYEDFLIREMTEPQNPEGELDPEESPGWGEEECPHQYAEVGTAPLGVRCIKCGHFVGAWE